MVRRGRFSRFSTAILIAVIAVALRIAAWPVLTSSVPYITCFAATMISGWFSGAGPALVTALVSGVGVLWLVVEPRGSLVPQADSDAAGFIAYLFVSLMIAGLFRLILRERERAEEAAGSERAQRLWLSSTLASVGDAVIATDANGRVEFMNAVAEALTEQSSLESVGRPIEEVFVVAHEGSPEPLANPARSVLVTGSPQNLDDHTVLVGKNGRRTPIDDSASPIRNSSGVLLGAVLVFRDITERQKAERALRANQENLQLALTGAQMGTWNRDLMADRVEWSQQLEVLFGLQPGEFSGSREEFLQFIHPADREAYVQGIQKAIESRTDYVVEFRFYTRDGRLRWMEGRGRAFYDRSGRPVRLAGIGVDITERKLVEQKLRDMNEELERFAYAASHDLKEPLRMVSMYVQLLERKYKDQLDADGLQFIRFAKDGALRMGQLIDALLAYSQAGRSDLLQTQGVDSGLALAAALANLAPAIDEAEAVVTFDDLPRVVADEVHVTQLFQNLIGNALKYRGKAAPVVHVRGEQVAGEYVFSVSDNGIGIAEEDQSRIFGVFQRLHGREYAGAGIGLATCRKIVEAYCGRIWVESIPGKGSTFFFTLPAAERVKESAAS